MIEYAYDLSKHCAFDTYCFRGFGFAIFLINTTRLIVIMCVIGMADDLSHTKFVFLFRTNDLGSSVSTAQVMFDVIDRTPAIDNMSEDGGKLVRQFCT